MLLLRWLSFAAIAALGQAQDLNRYPPQPQLTTCGDIVAANTVNQSVIFTASEFIDCLTSVPFNGAVALRYLNYLNTTFQFYSTATYLRNPSPGYQQPPVDLFGEIQRISEYVIAGAYHNQYAFEAAVQELIQRVHDSHVEVIGGIFSTFAFYGPRNLVSVSVDGKQAPEIYIYEELIQQVTNGIPASPIKQIDGVDAVDYLMNFAAQQSFGLVEPHADWNNLFYSPAVEVFGLSSFSDAATFYPGDNFNLTFANGSATQDEQWLSIYLTPEPTGPLETGGDFYNFFVLGLAPASSANTTIITGPNNTIDATGDATSTASDTSSTTSSTASSSSPVMTTSWYNISHGYPNETLSSQADLGVFTPGAVTSYYLSDISTAVLSLPTFQFYGDSIVTFGQAITDFVNNASAKNAERIVIDLQQNAGGLLGAAIFVYNEFFPTHAPWTGSRMRSHPLADLLGNAYTSLFERLNVPDLSSLSSDQDYLYLDLVQSEWVPVVRVNAETGMNFTSWRQFAGPIDLDNDTFSLIEEYDLSATIFDEYVFDATYAFDVPGGPPPPWAAQDIVILTDGLCASACTLFVEMMRQMGVRSVVVGGNPTAGPMQAASGTRGAVDYSGSDLNDDFNNIGTVNATVANLIPSTLSDTGMALGYTGFTLRDQVRPNSTVANQVLYLPADCRLYWTFANFYNYTRLWEDVYTAIYTDPSICVAGSTNITTPPPSPSTAPPSSIPYDLPLANLSLAFAYDTALFNDGPPPLPIVQFCDDSSCAPDSSCQCLYYSCQNAPGAPTFNIYTRPISALNQNACGNQVFVPRGYVSGSLMNSAAYSSSASSSSNSASSNNLQSGFCQPPWSKYDIQNTQCTAIETEVRFQNVLTAKYECPDEDC